jgi:hypothetical protein
MPTPSNYPPGVSGNEPQITGYGDEPFDERDYSDDYDVPQEVLYLVHTPCGEAFAEMKIAYDHAHSGDCENYRGEDLDQWSLLPESEAI